MARSGASLWSHQRAALCKSARLLGAAVAAGRGGSGLRGGRGVGWASVVAAVGLGASTFGLGVSAFGLGVSAFGLGLGVSAFGLG
ncbi:MAG TPA: hypothetical protein DEA08_37140, partial [Planctomycetes bacterium]|nr:hypothetical protein [Planctomycetota bacterium]